MLNRFRSTNSNKKSLILVPDDQIQIVNDKIQANEGIPNDQQRLMFVPKEEDVNQDEVEAHQKNISERNKEIHEIAAQIREIREIMTDLTNMVSHQGDIIDNIEANIEATNYSSKIGVIELEKAHKHQKRTTCNIQ